MEPRMGFGNLKINKMGLYVTPFAAILFSAAYIATYNVSVLTGVWGGILTLAVAYIAEQYIFAFSSCLFEKFVFFLFSKGIINIKYEIAPEKIEKKYEIISEKAKCERK